MLIATNPIDSVTNGLNGAKTVLTMPFSSSPAIMTPRLQLEPLRPDHSAAILGYYLRNADHLKPWEPTRGAAFFEPQSFATAVNGWVAACDAGQSLRFIIKHRATSLGGESSCIGVVNFTHITPLPMLGCNLGYGLDAHFEGLGLMREALQALVQHMFKAHRVHRIAANHMPANLKSAATLQALGFQVEGLARAYLHINGNWEDHVLTALVHPD